MEHKQQNIPAFLSPVRIQKTALYHEKAAVGTIFKNLQVLFLISQHVESFYIWFDMKQPGKICQRLKLD